MLCYYNTTALTVRSLWITFYYLRVVNRAIRDAYHEHKCFIGHFPLSLYIRGNLVCTAETAREPSEPAELFPPFLCIVFAEFKLNPLKINTQNISHSKLFCASIVFVMH